MPNSKVWRPAWINIVDDTAPQSTKVLRTDHNQTQEQSQSESSSPTVFHMLPSVVLLPSGVSLHAPLVFLGLGVVTDVHFIVLFIRRIGEISVDPAW